MKIDLDKILEVAVQTASKSQCHIKVSCILVDKRGKIVAKGFNHWTNHNEFKLGKRTVHAEMDALNQVRKPSNNLVAFIYRKNAKKINPCEPCSKLLKSYGITNVFCTNSECWEKQTEV
jgi:deoxycytidylate deaminase